MGPPLFKLSRHRYHLDSGAGDLMPRRINETATALILSLVGLAPVLAQAPPPEFNIFAAPSVVTVVQGQVASLAVTVACNTASFKAVADCNARPEFGIHLSQLPYGVQA